MGIDDALVIAEKYLDPYAKSPKHTKPPSFEERKALRRIIRALKEGREIAERATVIHSKWKIGG